MSSRSWRLVLGSYSAGNFKKLQATIKGIKGATRLAKLAKKLLKGVSVTVMAGKLELMNGEPLSVADRRLVMFLGVGLGISLDLYKKIPTPTIGKFRNHYR